MNKSSGPGSFLLPLCRIGLIAGILFLSCKGPHNRKDAGNESILAMPPFVSLTDSIRHSDPGGLAGLYFRRAELLSKNNFHEIAANDYQRSWELRPEENTGLRYAATLSITGRTVDAVSLLQDCLKKFPGNSSFASMLGDIYVQSGRLKESLGLYDHLLEKDSLNFEAWYEKGLLLEKARDTAGAITALNKAWSLQPVNTYALELAHIYAERGNPQALQICDEVLSKDRNNELVDPFFIKGIYYSNSRQYKKAMDQFDSCIRRDWKFTDAYLEKGIILYKQKNYGEALKTFQMTITVSNTYPDGYYWMARCYEATGRKDEALMYYQEALALDKDFSEARDGIKRLKI
ncbi:MAG TPA: tetratricopeptide repeat protein [Puia sp.]|nr:tetratricopeptide repeat protein [Puia sp.]